MKKKYNQLTTYLKKKNKFILQNPKTFEEKFSLSISKRNTMLAITMITLIFSFLVYLIISYTGLKRFIPGYPKNASELYQTNQNNLALVSDLEDEFENRELWINNLQNILNNEDSVLLSDLKDTLIKDTNFDYKQVIFERVKEDSVLRKKVENYNLSNQSSIVRSILISVLKYEKPHSGKIIGRSKGKINQATYQAKYKSKVKTAMEGVVISKSKKSIVLQHPNNIVSIYDNFDDISAKVGEQIKKGKNIGIVKDSVFRFQIWYKGNSVPVEAFEDL